VSGTNAIKKKTGIVGTLLHWCAVA